MTWTILALYGMVCVGFTLGWITCAAMAHQHERNGR